VHIHTATLGYWLGEDFWGRGIMTEAVAAFIDFCFENFPLRRVSAEVFANNPASARVLEKAGFRFRRTPNEQRHQGWRTSRFTALREDEVETRRRCVRAEWRQLYLAV
jgi:RimJ/RimL family protein N-acetyltransferase